MVGIEPTYDEFKVHCLTTWRHPNKLIDFYFSEDLYKKKTKKN